MKTWKRIGIVWACLAAGLMPLCWATAGGAAETEEEVQQLEDVVVKDKGGAPGLQTSPTETVIELDKFKTIAAPNSIVDVLKTQAIIDFRGESDYDPGVDSIYMRGFDSTRFVTAVDSLTLQKTGGRKSSNVVDYATLPAFLIDKVEILPGPHSALFDSKSIGGVLNFITRTPKRRQSLKPDLKLSTSYSSYNTWSSNVSLQGAAQAFTYDLGYQNYQTDGYLRNTEGETNNFFGRFGLVLPGDGFIALSTSYSDIDRQAPVTNEPGGDYDSSYPETDEASFEPYAKPIWDSISTVYRLNYEQTLPVIGRLHVGAYQSKDNRTRAYYVNEGDTERSVMDTDWWGEGGKIQDEISWADNHTTTVGVDLAKLYDDGLDNSKTERINKKGAFLQHQWGITPSLDLRAGLRYEDVHIWVTNNGAIPDREDIIERHWDQAMPKSFATWRMDGLATWLRDTSLSAGVSKIWRAPDYHGDYNPQGRPAGAWLEPEHGIGYDLVFDRRLWRDISLQVNYAFYDIEDYIASNSSYANYSGSSAGSLRYSDYKINLDRVHRHGVDLGLDGHIVDPLSFYLTYSWQRFYNQGDEPAGETALHQRAEHRVSAGLRYELLARTTLMIDYYYQSKEITEVSEEIAEDVYYFTEVENPSYNVFDFGIQYLLFNRFGPLQQGTFKFWIKNILDESYYNSSGQPATDRNYGVSFQFGV